MIKIKVKSIKNNFDKLVKLYPTKISFSNLISKEDINSLQNKLKIIIPEEFVFYLTNYKLNLLNSDFDILSIDRIIEETDYIRGEGADKNYLVISAYDEFYLCIDLTSKNKDETFPIIELTRDLLYLDEKKLAYSDLYKFLEDIIKQDIEWENEINEEEKAKQKELKAF